MLKRFRVIKWTFADMKGTDIIGKKWGMCKGQYKGLMFCVSGLGLTKAEREIFDIKFLERTGVYNIYLGKLIITYRAKGAYSNFRSVEIVSDEPLFA